MTGLRRSCVLVDYVDLFAQICLQPYSIAVKVLKQQEQLIISCVTLVTGQINCLLLFAALHDCIYSYLLHTLVLNDFIQRSKRSVGIRRAWFESLIGYTSIIHMTYIYIYTCIILYHVAGFAIVWEYNIQIDPLIFPRHI